MAGVLDSFNELFALDLLTAKWIFALNSLFRSLQNTEVAQLLVRYSWQRPPWSYLLATAGVCFMTVFIYASHADSSVANIPMLYLSVVLLSALFLSRLAAIFASVLSFLSFDYFFVDPKYQLTVASQSEWLSLCIFLFISFVVGQLVWLLRAQAVEAQQRKSETIALAEASWAIASDLDGAHALDQVISRIVRVAQPVLVVVFMPEPDGSLRIQNKFVDQEHQDDSLPVSPAISQPTAKFAMQSAKPVEESGCLYWPILQEDKVLCVVCLKLKRGEQLNPQQQQIFLSLLNHISLIIQRDQLMQAELQAQALKESDKLKTALLSMVSHDFRSPLTSILASVSALLDEEGEPLDPGSQQALLQAVDGQAQRLNRMVGNILDLSRLESGAWRPRREAVEVAELVGSVLDSFSAADNKRIRVDLAPQLPEIEVDSVQIVQVMRNLLENALKYSPSQSEVVLSSFSDGDNVFIEVSDHGPGLPKGDETRIFEPFYRAPGLKESAVPGLGIGLALSLGLAEANRGDLSAANRDGGGARFTVRVPKVKELASPDVTALM